MKKELERFAKLLSTEGEMEDKASPCTVREGVLKITLHVLRSMNEADLANALQISKSHVITNVNGFQEVECLHRVILIFATV